MDSFKTWNLSYIPYHLSLTRVSTHSNQNYSLQSFEKIVHFELSRKFFIIWILESLPISYFWRVSLSISVIKREKMLKCYKTKVLHYLMEAKSIPVLRTILPGRGTALYL